jgi:tetratricopeptide (TPR) repeat protein
LGSSADVVDVNLNSLALQNAYEKLKEANRQRQASLAQPGATTHPGNLQALLQLNGFAHALPDELSMAYGADAMKKLAVRWEKQKVALDANPPSYSAWNGYAELCLYLHHEDEYRSTRTRLLERFGDVTDAHTAERVGRACLLLPGSDEEFRKATALVDRAVNADKSRLEAWAGNYFQVAKALAEYRQGHLDNVSKILHGPAYQALQPMPQFIMVMVLQKQGDKEEARRLYDAAVTLFDWNPNRATNPDAWMFQALRREAEKMTMPATRPSGGP